MGFLRPVRAHLNLRLLKCTKTNNYLKLVPHRAAES